MKILLWLKLVEFAEIFLETSETRSIRQTIVNNIPDKIEKMGMYDFGIKPKISLQVQRNVMLACTVLTVWSYNHRNIAIKPWQGDWKYLTFVARVWQISKHTFQFHMVSVAKNIIRYVRCDDNWHGVVLMRNRSVWIQCNRKKQLHIICHHDKMSGMLLLSCNISSKCSYTILMKRIRWYLYISVHYILKTFPWDLLKCFLMLSWIMTLCENLIIQVTYRPT